MSAGTTVAERTRADGGVAQSCLRAFIISCFGCGWVSRAGEKVPMIGISSPCS